MGGAPYIVLKQGGGPTFEVSILYSSYLVLKVVHNIIVCDIVSNACCTSVSNCKYM